MQMHHHEDLDLPWADAINHSVREAPHLAPAQAGIQLRPSQGMGKDLLESSLKLQTKFLTQTRSAGFVMLDGLPDLSFGAILEAKLHFAKRAANF
ncbi:MAG: hypothetical protein RL095_2646 [Verrucomicrobiota bacterium]